VRARFYSVTEPAVSPTRNSFRLARGLRVVMSLGCPLLGAGQLWIAWTKWQDRLAGRGWQDDWHFALMLAVLAGLALLFAAGLALAWRLRIDLREDGFELRGLLRTRAVLQDNRRPYVGHTAERRVHFGRPSASSALFAGRGTAHRFRS
jgi:hypothetical protein